MLSFIKSNKIKKSFLVVIDLYRFLFILYPIFMYRMSLVFVLLNLFAVVLNSHCGEHVDLLQFNTKHHSQTLLHTAEEHQRHPSHESSSGFTHCHQSGSHFCYGTEQKVVSSIAPNVSCVVIGYDSRSFVYSYVTNVFRPPIV